MITFKERIGDMSSCLQSLTTPELLPKVQEAVEKKDRNLLLKVCKKAKIPEMYLGAVMSVVMSVSPDQKYPLWF